MVVPIMQAVICGRHNKTRQKRFRHTTGSKGQALEQVRSVAQRNVRAKHAGGDVRQQQKTKVENNM
jgi:hypothetical protein